MKGKKKERKGKLENLRRRIFLNYRYPFFFLNFVLSFNKKIGYTDSIDFSGCL